MIARCVWTLVTLFLAGYAFWGDALGMGHIFNPMGLLFLAIAAVVWFKWDAVASAFRAAHDESDLPIIRLGYHALKGAGFKTPSDEVPSERLSSGR
jgi:hypothetical protein